MLSSSLKHRINATRLKQIVLGQRLLCPVEVTGQRCVGFVGTSCNLHVKHNKDNQTPCGRQYTQIRMIDTEVQTPSVLGHVNGKFEL